MTIVILASALSQQRKAPLLIWNASASAPTGLYSVQGSGALRRGAYVLVTLPPPWAEFADAHGILPHGIPLLKPVAAMTGDRVCRVGRRITVNGRIAAIAYLININRRSLPRWRHCRVLKDGEIFVLARMARSFDSRYLGPIPLSSVIGPVQKLL